MVPMLTDKHKETDKQADKETGRQKKTHGESDMDYTLYMIVILSYVHI